MILKTVKRKNSYNWTNRKTDRKLKKIEIFKKNQQKISKINENFKN